MTRSQHIFLHPHQTGSPYRLTYSCVGQSANQRTFNDGYHIQHHLNSRVHWSELPVKFQDTLHQHDEESGTGSGRSTISCRSAALPLIVAALTCLPGTLSADLPHNLQVCQPCFLLYCVREAQGPLPSPRIVITGRNPTVGMRQQGLMLQGWCLGASMSLT